MADRAISALPTATQLTATDLFVLSQSNQAKNTTWQTIIGYLTAALDGHGGIQSIELTSSSGLEDTYTVTLADLTTYEITVTNGRSVSGRTQYWAVSDSDMTAPSSWQTTPQTMTVTNRYLWSYVVYAMNDGSSIQTAASVIGVYGDTGPAWYMWIRYAGQRPTSDADIGTDPDNWIGIYSGTSATAPTHYTDYTWFEFKGEKGDTGDAATVSNQTVTYMESTSGTVVPEGSWTLTIPTVTPGNFLWTRTVLVFNDGTIVTSYSVARFGIDGSGSVGSVNNISPDANGNIAIAAENIPTSDNSSVQSQLNTLKKYMTVIGEAAFEEEETDSQTQAVTQYFGFTPESGAATVDIQDGDLILIKFPMAHPWLAANTTRVGIVTPLGKVYYLVSSGDVVATGQYKSYYAFRFNGTFLMPMDINGMGEQLADLNSALNNAVLQPSSAFPIPSTSVTKTMTGITANHVLVAWNFSSSAENSPPCDLTWSTANGSFTITKTSGTTSESIQPVFALPTAVAVS